MSEEFYLDQDGVGLAATRFGSRASDLEVAATEGAQASVTGVQGPMGAAVQPVASAADDLLIAASGRLRAYGAELHALSGLIGATVTVANDIDVAYEL